MTTPQRPDLDLSFRLKVGDNWAAKETTEWRSYEFLEEPVIYTFEETATVTGVKDRTVSVRIARRLTEQKMGNEVIPLPPQRESTIIEETWTTGAPPSRGDLADDADMMAYRAQRAGWYVAPAEARPMGQTWSHSFEAIPVGRAPAAEAKWTLTGLDQLMERTVAKLSVSFKEKGIENPIEGTGQARVDIKTGLLLLLDMKAINAVQPGGDASLHRLKLRYEITKLNLIER